ncbi:MAG: SRPBCC family protein [Verrucomicrobiae bacterium]|nr:SRPBCC family protein [Verrucomicrobiae bacterium]
MNYELSITRDIPFADLKICLFRCWTEPELLKQWFCPKPWRVTDAEIDPRPGGRFNSTFAGPEGEEFPNHGSFLEVVDGEKLVFTSALLEDWTPVEDLFSNEQALPFVGTITFEDLGNGNLRYTARVAHWSAADRDRHAAMGFEQGWNAALDQLIELSANDTGPSDSE